MKLYDLYNRVVETTGLDVMTTASLQAAVANCMADLTSRGYRTFKEITLDKLDIIYQDDTMLVFKAPEDIRKVLYCRLFFNQEAIVAKRYSLARTHLNAKYRRGQFRTDLSEDRAVFYLKEDNIYLEWREGISALEQVAIGYYVRLRAPKVDLDNINNFDELKNVEIDIREEFEDALVFYTAYFYYSRYQKDTEKLQFYLNNYKYYVEDISHELHYEDQFYEDNVVITEED